MARAGLFDDVDFVYTWHPATRTGVPFLRSVAIMGANFRFSGLTAHAGATPHLGRSALDAAELMSVGVNYLREHMIDQARVHYAYSDAGGVAPNVVQDHAKVKYEVRAPKVSQVKELFERVVNVSRGAALMTGTETDAEITMAFSDYIPNAALARVGEECLREVGPPVWDEEDYALARAFVNSYNEGTKQAIREDMARVYGEDRVDEMWEKPLDDTVHPFNAQSTAYISGSTEVGGRGVCRPHAEFAGGHGVHRQRGAHLADDGAGQQLHCAQGPSCGRQSPGPVCHTHHGQARCHCRSEGIGVKTERRKIPMPAARFGQAARGKVLEARATIANIAKDRKRRIRRIRFFFVLYGPGRARNRA